MPPEINYASNVLQIVYWNITCNNKKRFILTKEAEREEGASKYLPEFSFVRIPEMGYYFEFSRTYAGEGKKNE